ncbi:MAG: hypothetical protein AABY39_07605 [Nitrospirota bacterium]
MSETIVIALIGVAGAIIGSIATMAGSIFLHCLKERAAIKRDKPRKELLLEMLENPKYQWRKLKTLMHVIGADEEKTKDLLLKVGARASEDGQPLWGLKKRNPLPKGKQ